MSAELPPTRATDAAAVIEGHGAGVQTDPTISQQLAARLDKVELLMERAGQTAELVTALNEYGPPRRSQQKGAEMFTSNQKVLVRSADGTEKELVFLRVAGQTAYVCAPSKSEEARQGKAGDFEVGVPLADVKEASRH